MVDIPIDDIAEIGVVHDLPGYELPPEAWTTALNMRCLDGGIEWVGGKTQIFGTPSVAPHFMLPVRDASAAYWIYTSLTKAYVYDGTNHTDITHASGDYTAAASREWNGVLFGGIPIINNGRDAPQFWDATLNIVNDFADLTNFPSGATARVMRSLGPYLIALDVTLSGTRYPHAVLWSHPADPGSLPTSWDHTDPTKDAGLNDLPDTLAGIIKDGLPLNGRMIIYKEGSTWRMTPITSGYIFDFEVAYETSGILAARCVTLVTEGNRHFVANQDDIILHDGQGEPQSLLTRRMRQYLQNQIDSTNYVNSFCFTNPEKNECWFCYPSSGETNPNMALIWNSREGGITEAEVNFRHAAFGPAPGGATSIKWNTITTTWNTELDTWPGAELAGVVPKRVVAVANTDDTKILRLDQGTTNDGSLVSGTLQRTGLSVTGRKRNGDWIVDFHKRKFLHRIRAKLSGGPVNVRVGFQELVDGTIEWSGYQSFDPTSMLYVDFAGSGQAIAVEFTSTNPFRLEGYVVEIEVIGEF